MDTFATLVLILLRSSCGSACGQPGRSVPGDIMLYQRVYLRTDTHIDTPEAWPNNYQAAALNYRLRGERQQKQKHSYNFLFMNLRLAKLFQCGVTRGLE